SDPAGDPDRVPALGNMVADADALGVRQRMASAIETRFVFTITVHSAEVTSAGDIGHGVRRIIPIIGGEVKGEKVNGKVLPFGADFQIIRPNELINPEAKTPLKPTAR